MVCVFASVCTFFVVLGTRWQELNGIMLISRDATRQENGVLFCIVGREGDQTLNLTIMSACLGLLLQLPWILVVRPEVR